MDSMLQVVLPWMSTITANLLVQCLVLSLGCWVILRLVRRKSPAVRSSISLNSLVVLLLLPVMSIAFAGAGVSVLKIIPAKKTFASSSESAGNVPSTFPQVISATAMPRSGPDVDGSDPTRRTVGIIWASPFFRALLAMAGLVWVSGALLCLVRIAYDIRLLRKLPRMQTLITDERILLLLKETSDSLGLRTVPLLAASPQVATPICMGIPDTRIVVPAALADAMTEKEWRTVFVHEIAHLKGKDPWAGLMQRMIQALYWWNPFVYSISRAFSIARDDLCDNHCILHLRDAHEYAENLVNLVERASLAHALPLTIGMASSNIPMGKRIETILSKERDMATNLSVARSMQHSALAVMIAVVACALYASSPTQKPLDYTPLGVGDVHQFLWPKYGHVLTWEITGMASRSDGRNVFAQKERSYNAVDDTEIVSTKYFYMKDGFLTQTSLDSFSDTITSSPANPFGEFRAAKQTPDLGATWTNVRGTGKGRMFYRQAYYGVFETDMVRFDSVYSVDMAKDSTEYTSPNASFMRMLYAPRIGQVGTWLPNYGRDAAWMYRLAYAKVNGREYGKRIR